MTLRAYLADVSVWPGEQIGLHVSSTSGGRAEIAEYRHSDPHPDGPGLVTSVTAWGKSTAFNATPVDAMKGSFLECDTALTPGSATTVSLWLKPTALSATSPFLAWAGGDFEWTLSMSAEGLELAGGGSSWSVPVSMHERVWHFVGIAITPEEVTVFGAPWGRTGGPFAFSRTVPSCVPAGSHLSVGSIGSHGAMDGLVAGLRVHDYALDLVDLMNVMNGVGPEPVRSWDFSDRSEVDLVPDTTGSEGLRLSNAPAWSVDHPQPNASDERQLCSAGSIHLHRDDIEDCRWPEVARFDVPSDVQSGTYVVRVEDERGQFQELPFIVKGRAKVTLLVPTLTWQAYANLGRGTDWPGLSHYALHSDGSPVLITTSRKPSQTFAPSARLEVDEADGFATGENLAHLFMADLYAWHWLKGSGHPVAVVDDLELHRSVEALEASQVLILSAHPEYWTASMLDHLEQYIERGGSVIYLGGNGLYWVVTLHPEKPYLMEIRRWGGSQTWSVEEADRLHQFEPRTGGLWEDAGRPPNSLLGVGFAGFGNGPSLTYRRSTASYEAEWSWLFDGVDARDLGGGGINTGAGNEFDSFDESMPGPGVSTVLATATPQRPDCFGTFEKGGRRAPHPDVRADLVATRTPAGGLVLAISSISASSSLVIRRGDGLERVFRNALEGMLT